MKKYFTFLLAIAGVALVGLFLVGEASARLTFPITQNLASVSTTANFSTTTFSGNITVTSTATTTINGAFVVNTNKLAVQDGTGFVGIGTSTPTHKLEVVGETGIDIIKVTAGTNLNTQTGWLTVQDRARFGFNAGLVEITDAGTSKNISFQSGALGNEVLRIANNSRVGVVTTTPAATFAVEGGAYIAGSTTMSNLVATSTVIFAGLPATAVTDDLVCWDSTGRLTHQATNCTVSAKRFKMDIRPLDDGLLAVLKMKAMQFTNKTNNQEEIGFIAEDMAQIDKRLVAFDKDGQARTLDYARITAYLVPAMQEQQRKITSLDSQNNLLGLRIKALEGKSTGLVPRKDAVSWIALSLGALSLLFTLFKKK